MKKHETKKNSRRWVIRAMGTFLVVLALLTFFSNTIMNATIPLVVTATAQRGNLSYTRSATGQLESDNKIEVKGLDGRTVDQVLHTNYDTVQEGDVILTLVPQEDMSELTQLETQLTQLQNEQVYAQMTPNRTDFTAQNQAIRTAERALAEAQANLNSATTRDETIAAAQQVLAANQAAVSALQAQQASASASVEYINTQLAALYAQLAVIDGTAAPVIPTTTTSGMYAASPNPAKNDPDPAADPNATESTTTAPSETTTAPSESSTETTAAPTETTAPTPTPVPAPPTPDRQTILNQIAQLQGELTDAQNRLSGYSAQLTAAQSAVTAAQTAITQAEALPSTYAAQDAVTDAQAALTAAQYALSDAQATASVNALRAADTAAAREQQIADLEDKIERVRARLTQTEIVAPASGYLYNLTVSAGDKFQGETVIFTIIPEDSTYSVSFNFPTNAVQSYQVGQEFSASNYYYIDRIVITNIKPDPNNPRDGRIVKCAVYSSMTLLPGESITVTADKGNATYDHVVPSSAVSEDNSGQFVFVVNQTSGPLGDRYTVRRVSISVLETSGAFCAIQGEGLDNVMVVTRSEEPLHNGDRVRLEDYSDNSN